MQPLVSYSIGAGNKERVRKFTKIGFATITIFVIIMYGVICGFTNGLIHDDIWMKMLKTRNLLAHDYDGTIAQREFDIIISGYYDAFTELKNTVTKYYDGSLLLIDEL